jgi:hypothetical protein
MATAVAQGASRIGLATSRHHFPRLLLDTVDMLHPDEVLCVGLDTGEAAMEC